MKKYLISLFLVLITSCASNDIYLCVSDDYIDVYESPDRNSIIIESIKPGKYYLGKRYKKNYWNARTNNRDGYILSAKSRKVKVDKKYYDYLHYDENKGYYIDKSKNRSRYNYNSSSISSSRGSNSSNYKSTGGSVQVKGYYRKDGTYVKPHTRRSPSKSSYKSSSRRR